MLPCIGGRGGASTAVHRSSVCENKLEALYSLPGRGGQLRVRGRVHTDSPASSLNDAVAMATCGSLQLLHGSLPSAPRSVSSLRSAAAARSIALGAGGSRTLPSDVGCNAGERWEKSGRRTRGMVPACSKTDDRVELGENPEGIISGEWPDNFSLLSYDDLRAYLEPQVLKEQMTPSAPLGDVMSTKIRVATADQILEEIDHHFEFVSGLPVVDDELRCIGVISKTDKDRAPHGVKSKVGDVMSSPPITLTPDKTVMDAAVLMLKMKIHRIPVLNDEQQVIGMVTRTDIFQALEAVAVEV